VIEGIHHIGIAVRSVEVALARYRALGLISSSVEEVPAEGVRVAFLRSGTTRIELLESLHADGVIARFVEKRGEGVHHIAFATKDVVAEMARLGEQGFELVDRAPRTGAHGRKVAFIHPRSAHGVLLELVEEQGAP